MVFLLQERLFGTRSNAHRREAFSMSGLPQMFQSSKSPQTSRRRRPQKRRKQLRRIHRRFKRRREQSFRKFVDRGTNKSGGQVAFRQLSRTRSFCQLLAPDLLPHSSSGKLGRPVGVFAVHRDLLKARRRNRRRSFLLTWFGFVKTGFSEISK